MAASDLTPLQTAVNEVATSWPEARAKQVFGHRGFVRNGKMFGFLADDGIAIKVMAGAQSDVIYALEGVHAFAYNAMEMRAWPIMPLRDDADLEAGLTALREAYERAVAT